jgi:copper transport protein
VLLVPLLSFMVVVLVTLPAAAHTGFESSEPADGERSDVPVTEIVLTFTGPADPVGEGFVVLDPGGVVRSPDRIDVDSGGQVWTLAFDPPLAGGAVGVRWTVQAPDAHPIEGAFSFTVGNPVVVTTPTTPPDAETSDPAIGPTPDELAETEPEAAIDLDAFLAQGEASLPYADGVGVAGRLIGFVGTILTIGGLAFVATVVRDRRRDMRSVLRGVEVSALAIVIGTAVDVVAWLAAANGGWWGDVLDLGGFESVASSAFGVAVGLRAAAGALLFVAVRKIRRALAPMRSVSGQRELVMVGARAISSPASSPDVEPGFVADRPPPGHSLPDQPRFAPENAVGPWWPATPLTVGLVIALLASFAFDGHTATEGNRWITGAVDMIHVLGASIWAGGVVALAVVLWRRHRRAERLNGLELALRFSTIAGAALVLAGIAGAGLSAIILDEVSQLWTTPWGRLLVAKTLAVAAAAAVGIYNHFIVIPWMSQHPNDDTRSVRIRNTATAEAVLLVVAISLTAALVGGSSQ